MPLECVMFCLDTSSFMRNGDLHPTRLGAQQQAITSISQYKLDDNAESSIGLLTMAGNKVDVKISPSRERHKLLNVVKALQPQGFIDIQSSLRISQLTLRNRSNPHQRPRIVMFIASPINLTDEQLVASGKELKKNNIALDIVLFGYESLDNGNFEKSQLLINTVQNAGNSRLVVHYDPSLMDLSTLPSTTQASIQLNTNNATLADVVIRSAIGRNIQPSQPPQQRPITIAAPATPAVTNVGNTTLGPAANQGVSATMMDEDEDLDEDLLAAMALSQMEYEQSQQQPQQPQQPQQQQQQPESKSQDVVEEEEEEEMDADLLAAIQLSLEAEAAEAAAQNDTKDQKDEKDDKEKAKKDEEDEDDFNALLEAVSGGAVTKEEKKD